MSWGENGVIFNTCEAYLASSGLKAITRPEEPSSDRYAMVIRSSCTEAETISFESPSNSKNGNHADQAQLLKHNPSAWGIKV